jgi:glycosyltransferase involved in cell wall biosynthesis
MADVAEDQPAAHERAPGNVGKRRRRLAVICDYLEENWPSMDLCADMLLNEAEAHESTGLTATRLCPPFRRRLSAVPLFGRTAKAFNADRFLNRHLYFPRHLRRHREDFDVFHVCDHSYGQLALELPAARTGVLCHDVDAFRSLLDPAQDRRPGWYRWMMGRVLRGLRTAAVVFHTTAAVRDEILQLGLVPAEKLVHAPLGQAPEFRAESKKDSAADRIFADLMGKPFLLHVGSCIPRKRIDFLLQVFAEVRCRFPGLRLVKVGGTWSPDQKELIRRFRLEGAIIHVQGVERTTLAALYQKTELVLLPSDAEGFGLPVVEALACAAPVLASDLPVLREVGGSAVLYGRLLDLESWRELVIGVLTHPDLAPPRKTRLAQANKYSWREHARIILQTYRELAA